MDFYVAQKILILDEDRDLLEIMDLLLTDAS